MNRGRKERRERILRELEMLKEMSAIGSTLLTSEIRRAPISETPPAGADHAQARDEWVGHSPWTRPGDGLL